MWPVVDQLRKDGYIIFYVDLDKHAECYSQFEIRKKPTTIVFDNKKPTIRFDGYASADDIAKHLKTRKEQGLKTSKDKK